MNNPIIPPTPTDAEYAKRADRPDHKMFAIDDPISYFEQWLAEAGKTEANDPNAMTLSTVDNMGLPDSRIVLLKGVDDRGFVFYSNGNSDPLPKSVNKKPMRIFRSAPAVVKSVHGHRINPQSFKAGRSSKWQLKKQRHALRTAILFDRRIGMAGV